MSIESERKKGYLESVKEMVIPPGFIKEAYEMLCRRFKQMNRDYLLAVAELVLSSASWNVYIIDKYGLLTPNVWYLIVIPSGEGKSLPIDYFLVPTLQALEKKLETDKEIYKLYIADYTKEGIVKFFSDRTKIRVGSGKKRVEKRAIFSRGLLIKDEATMFLEAVGNKGYMADIIGVESKIYDGTLYRRITTSRNLEEVPRCFKSSIMASTRAIYILIKNNSFIQGGMNRYDTIIGNPLTPEEIELLDDDFFFGEKDKEELQAFEKIPSKYAERLAKIAKGPKIYVMLDEKASLLWRQYKQKMSKMAVELDDMDLRRGYLQRQAEKVLKRAMLYTMSNHMGFIDMEGMKDFSFVGFGGKVKEEKMILCGEEEMKVAINNQERLYQYWLQMLEERKKAPPDSRVTTDAAEMEYFAAKCRELGKEFGVFSRALILERTKWHDGERKLPNNINTFMQLGNLRLLREEKRTEILIQHKAKNDLEWFEALGISPSFKYVPHLYKWVEK